MLCYETGAVLEPVTLAWRLIVEYFEFPWLAKVAQTNGSAN
jgi:hypothetical protein